MFLPCPTSRMRKRGGGDQDDSPLLRGERASHEIACVPRYLSVPGELLVTVSQDDPRLLNLYTPRLELRKIHFGDARREVWEKSLFPRFVPDDATPRLSIDGVELPRETPYADASEFWNDLCLLFAPDCIISTAAAIVRTPAPHPAPRKRARPQPRKKPYRRLSDLLATAVPLPRSPGCHTAPRCGSSCVR